MNLLCTRTKRIQKSINWLFFQHVCAVPVPVVYHSISVSLYYLNAKNIFNTTDMTLKVLQVIALNNINKTKNSKYTNKTSIKTNTP